MTRRALLALVAALVLLRLSVVASAAEVFGYGEEFGKGAAAKAMLDGLPVAHHTLAYSYPEGGGFAVTHLKAALFALMGPCVLANKVAAILLCAVLLWTVIAFAREHLGELTAVVFAALFVLAPLNFVRFSLLNLGTHFEALIFVVLVLHFTLRVARDARARTRDAVLLGLAGGFGLWFSLQIVPALAASVIWILVRWRGRIRIQPTAAALAGFVVGAIPLWIMMALVGSQALLVRGHETMSHGPGFFDSLCSMLAPITTSHGYMTWALTVTMLVAIAAGTLVRGTSAHALSLLYAGIYALIFATSGLALLYDPDAPGSWFLMLRLTPFWLFAMLFAAHGIAVSWEQGGWKRRLLAASAGGMIIVSGAIDFATLCRTGHPTTPIANLRLVARTKGYDYGEYFDKFRDHLEGTAADKARVLLAFHDDPRTLVPAICFSLFKPSNEAPAAVVAQCRAWFGKDAPEAWRGLGLFLLGWDYDLPAAFATIETLDADAQESLAEGLGRAGLGPRLIVSRLEQQVARDVPERFRNAWLRGCGWRAHFTFRFRPDLAREFIERCDVVKRMPLQQGYDEACDLDSL